MSVNKRHVWLFVRLVLVALVVYMLLPPWFITAVHADGVKAGKVISWHSAVVHASPEYFVKVGGKTYREVRCSPKAYFVWLDKDHKEFFFVTKTDYDNGTMYHVIDVHTGKERHVATRELFGYGLRSEPDPGEFFVDYVDSYDGRKLRVVSRGRWLDTLDFETDESSSQDVNSGG